MNTKTQKLPEIELTDDILKRMKRYDVELMEGNCTVRHLTYGTVTEVSPSMFAVFVTAIKAVYVSWMLARPLGEWMGIMNHYDAIGANCKPPIVIMPLIGRVDLIDGEGGSSKWTAEDEEDKGNDPLTKKESKALATNIREHSGNYHFCARIIRDAGLYRDLLD